MIKETNEEILELFRASKYLSFIKFLNWHIDVQEQKDQIARNEKAAAEDKSLE